MTEDNEISIDDMQKEKYEILRKYFGYKSFREGQEEVIDYILDREDTVAIMPTGAGKSICFQIPALIFKGITIVISPLISLMKDQVGALNQVGVHAAYLNSSLTTNQYFKALENAKAGRYKIIYVAPERLLTESFLDFALNSNIELISIDEAHCVSQWGQDFRPGYLKITQFIDMLKNKPIICAFTATATPQVREDIIYLLKLRNERVVVTGFDRPNLYFEVKKPVNKEDTVIEYLEKHRDKSGIIYCATRKSVDELTQKLCSKGYDATRYHAGLSDIEKSKNQDDFLYDEKQIMVATNAFGMGIDKSNVSFVIHYNMPKNMESYYQEAGRAGRDGEPADCILLYGGKDVVLNQYFIDNTTENEEMDSATLKVVKEKDREKLKQMTFYCHTNDCLREYMLKYFGEHSINYCNHCSNCNQNFEEIDITKEARIIIDCVKAVGERYGVNIIIDTLRGMDNEKIRRYKTSELSEYGSLKSISKKKLHDMINHLVLGEYLFITNSEYPVITLGNNAQDVLENKLEYEIIKMKLVKEEYIPKKAKEIKKKENYEEFNEDIGLFEELRRLRMKLATAGKVPPYVVFADAALHDMCRKLPKNKEEFLNVSGVGQAKLDKYGDAFLKVIKNSLH